MGNQILTFITQQCDTLTATMSPSVDAIGLHIVLSLATIMMVWFGVQEALASAQGGPGFNMAKFLNFFMLISFAYMFVKYYDSSIPGIGYSLKGFISQAQLIWHRRLDRTASSPCSSRLIVRWQSRGRAWLCSLHRI